MVSLLWSSDFNLIFFILDIREEIWLNSAPGYRYIKYLVRLAKYLISQCFVLCWYHSCTLSCLMIFSLHQIVFVWSNEKEWDWQSMWHVWKCRGLGNMKERKHPENLGLDEKIIVKWLLNKQDAALIGLVLGIYGGPLWILEQIFGFHQVWGISWLAERILAQWICLIRQLVCCFASGGCLPNVIGDERIKTVECKFFVLLRKGINLHVG